MISITIPLPASRLVELKQKALRLAVTPEDLVRIGVEEVLARPDEELKPVVDRVLEKDRRPELA